jgi:hypothetical protein
MARSNTRFLIAARRGALRRFETIVSRSAVIRAVGTFEPWTNSMLGIRLRRSGATGYPAFLRRVKDRIEAAKDEWRKAEWGRGLFDLPPDDRDEYTPLPPTRP